MATLLESFGALDKLEGFLSANGRAFYGEKAKDSQQVTIVREDVKVKGLYEQGDIQVVPFWAGQNLGWKIV